MLVGVMVGGKLWITKKSGKNAVSIDSLINLGIRSVVDGVEKAKSLLQ